MRKYLTIFLTVIFLGGLTSLLAQTVDVTFQVDMSVQINKGFFNPDSHVVTVPGSMNNWLNEPPANTDKVATDEDGDSIYTYTIAVTPNATYEYKYNIGLGWESKDEPGANRTVDIGASDTTLPVVYFKNELPPSGNPAPVTFNVDMRLPAQGSFNPTTQTVYVAGNFTDPQWADGALAMTDTDNDTVFTVTTDVNSGQNIEFKFLYSSGAASAGTWESTPNRRFFVQDTGNTISVFWEDKNPNVQLGDGSIVFTVDMSVMEEVGIYNPSTDSLQLRGSFNGWSDVPAARMDQNPLNPNSWTLTQEFINGVVGEMQSYKYFIDVADTSLLHYTDGYERPVHRGGGNREVEFMAQENQTVGDQYYDNVQPDWVIPAGTSQVVTFQVDMKPAIDALKQPIPFNPATDKLYWICEQPAFVVTQGWRDSNEMMVLELTDTDGDSIYTGTLTLQTPTFNSFEYRYGFTHVDGTETSWIREPEGFSAFAYRTRYIHQTAERTFVNPYTMNLDTWTNAEIKPASERETDPYNNIVGVEQTDTKALTYKLNQNFPNPFNPATKISFSIPEAGLVTLKVYNLLGEEIATILNQELKSGTFEVDFDASQFTSGVYFYKITTGNYSATKKMMLLK